MNTLKVVNIKCGGCEKGIISALEKKGLSNVRVNVANQTISFDGDINIARKKLASMGYPEAGSKQAKSILKKAKSYMSCAVGKMK